MLTFVMVAVTLLIYLVAKQLAAVARTEFAQRLANFLTVPIIPLLIFFLLVAFLGLIRA
jgi:peptidoglycan biosynthesis protein MviN/MurJ (putative lipid II flippase)